MPKPAELDSSLLVRKGDVPETAKPPSASLPEGRVNMTYRVRQSMHERLRNIAHQERRPIQELIDEAMEAWLSGRKD